MLLLKECTFFSTVFILLKAYLKLLILKHEIPNFELLLAPLIRYFTPVLLNILVLIEAIKLCEVLRNIFTPVF